MLYGYFLILITNVCTPLNTQVPPRPLPPGVWLTRVTIQIPACHAPPRRTATINHSNPGTPGSYFKQYLAEAPCFPAKSRPPPPRDSIDWYIIRISYSNHAFSFLSCLIFVCIYAQHIQKSELYVLSTECVMHVFLC